MAVKKTGRLKQDILIFYSSSSRTDYMFGPGPFDISLPLYISWRQLLSIRSFAIHHEGTQYT